MERIVDWYAASKANAKSLAEFPDFKTWYMEVLPRRQKSGRFKIDPETDAIIRKKLEGGKWSGWGFLADVLTGL